MILLSAQRISITLLLNDPRSVKVIVNRRDRKIYKPARVQRTLVISIECISADGRSLPPVIIWPAVTQRSNWPHTPHPDGIMLALQVATTIARSC